ncbi:uncharacterized protein LOC143889694 [Tasmannia lanceolata]|uniref:uncharacterized protein LOC143889694 n=1 Tax=Tasmannia lanceolata TaxID=3420 RepID=UPI0040649AA4
MARGTRGRRRLYSRRCRSTPYPLPSCGQECLEEQVKQKKSSKALEKKDWEDVTCSVCMEYPHNAVLLLCSSHDKGCHPYMCGTSYRHSNCLDQYTTAYTKLMSPSNGLNGLRQLQDGMRHGSVESFVFSDPGWLTGELSDLACPLCRGQVKGWTVVEAARKYLNAKERNCMQDECSFIGTYKELRKHVRAKHPCARPREVDPILEQKWRRLERERERDDVISTIRSSIPGAMVMGDYVIEGTNNNFRRDYEGEIHEDGDYEVGGDEGNWPNVLFLLQAFGSSGNVSFSSRLRRLERGYRTLDEGGSVLPVAAVTATSEGEDESSASRGRTMVGLGRSERRRRRRQRRSRRRSVIDVT